MDNIRAVYRTRPSSTMADNLLAAAPWRHEALVELELELEVSNAFLATHLSPRPGGSTGCRRCRSLKGRRAAAAHPPHPAPSPQ